MPAFARRLTLIPLLAGWLLAATASDAAPAASVVPGASGAPGAPVDTLTVFAASSLTNVLQTAGEQYTAATGQKVRFSFGSSAALARQIEAGAGADLYVAADGQWMDYLEQRALLRPRTRAVVAGNRLVLIASRDNRVSLPLVKGVSLASALGEGRLAVADPASVPAGRYAQQALSSLGAWSTVASRTVNADDVRHALNFVARGEAPLGIVYATDAKVEPAVRVVAVFPASTHDPIVYPLALTASGARAAAAFSRFLLSARGQALFAAAGFVRAAETSPSIPPPVPPR